MQIIYDQENTLSVFSWPALSVCRTLNVQFLKCSKFSVQHATDLRLRLSKYCISIQISNPNLAYIQKSLKSCSQSCQTACPFCAGNVSNNEQNSSQSSASLLKSSAFLRSFLPSSIHPSIHTFIHFIITPLSHHHNHHRIIIPA